MNSLVSIVLGCVGAYVLVSIFFLCFPGLLHRHKRLQSPPKLHSSHRGGSAETTENTLPAFRHAVRHGSELLELDVHLTRDGQVVVNHDADLTRQCGVSRLVSSFDYSELPRYLHPHKLPLPPQYYPVNEVLGTQNGYIGPNGPFKPPAADIGRMPLLEECFAEFVRGSPAPQHPRADPRPTAVPDTRVPRLAAARRVDQHRHQGVAAPRRRRAD